MRHLVHKIKNCDSPSKLTKAVSLSMAALVLLLPGTSSHFYSLQRQIEAQKLCPKEKNTFKDALLWNQLTLISNFSLERQGAVLILLR